MSNNTEGVAQHFALAKRAIENLERAAMRNNADALKALIDVAVEATTATHCAFSGSGISNPFAVGGDETNHDRHRRFLRQLTETSPGFFPVLYELPLGHSRWDDESEKITARVSKKSPQIVRQETILSEIVVSQTKGRGRDGRCRHALETMLIPWANRIRDGEIDGPVCVKKLPVLKKSTASQWAKALRDRLWEKKQIEICTKGAEWNWLAEGWKRIFSSKENAYNETTGKMVMRLKRDGDPKAESKEAVRKTNWEKKIMAEKRDEAVRQALYQNILDGLKGLTPAH